ncbi:MAG TPA: insulinase family protein, partial [Clostridiaceae bacterium]
KTLYIYTAVGEEHVKEALDAIESCIRRVKSEEIVFDENTINLMKKVMNTAVAFTLEDSTDIGNYVLHQMIEDESVLEFVEDMERLEKIKKEDIYKIAAKVLENPTIHIIKNEN